MIITKIIEVGIDVQNTINIYTDENNIKNIIIDKFEGKCFRGCWIRNINRIIKIGECVINQEGAPDFGTIPVIFEVSAVIYAVGEVLHGCTVVNRDKDGIIICQTDIASIMLNAHKTLESITKGQIISVRVGHARYNLGTLKISINAIPFSFLTNAIIFKMGPLTEQALDLFANVLSRIEFEESEMEKLKRNNHKAWDFFNQLLYAYNKPQLPPPNAKSLNILSIARGQSTASAYLCRDNKINSATPVVYGYETASNARTNVPAEQLILMMLEDYCAGMRNIREMLEIYSTPELLTAHNNLWRLFMKNKLG